MGGGGSKPTTHGPSTPLFTGVHPGTERIGHHSGPTTVTSAAFVIPDGWKDHCNRDTTWCREFIHEAIKNLQIPSLFPGVTVATIKNIPKGVLDGIKARCKSNTTCTDEGITEQINKITENFILQRFGQHVTNVQDPLPLVAIIAVTSIILAIVGGMLLFYFIFAPSIQPNYGGPGIMNFGYYAEEAKPEPARSTSLPRSRSKQRRTRTRSSRRVSKPRSSSRKTKSRKSKKGKRMKSPRSILKTSKNSRSRSKKK